MAEQSDSATTQPSLGESVGSEPEIGVSLDERTHFGHVRYAATETPGVIWYDPRDGHEYLNIGADTDLESLDFDDRVLTSVRIHAKHGRCQEVDPNDEWVLRLAYASKTEVDIGGETYVQKQNMERTSTYESVYAAREAARKQVPAYENAEYRDAVRHRTGGSDE